MRVAAVMQQGAGRWAGPAAFSAVVHVLAITLLLANWSFSTPPEPPPPHVRAVVVERAPAPPAARPLPPAPKPEPAPEPQAAPKPDPKPVPKPEPKPAAKPAPKPAAKPAPKPVVQPKPAEKPKPALPAPDFAAMLAAEEKSLAAREASARAQNAAADAAQQAQATADAAEIAEYKALIGAAAARRWSRPPSARAGMEALLRITLIPGGEVVDVQLVKSSGDAAFDRSAETAVRLAGRLPVPSDPRLFDANFRRFMFRFRPEDLNP